MSDGALHDARRRGLRKSCREAHFEVAERSATGAASASALCSTLAHNQELLGAGRRRGETENDAVQVAV